MILIQIRIYLPMAVVTGSVAICINNEYGRDAVDGEFGHDAVDIHVQMASVNFRLRTMAGVDGEVCLEVQEAIV